MKNYNIQIDTTEFKIEQTAIIDTISNKQDMDKGIEIINLLKSRIKFIQEKIKPSKDKAFEAHKEICALEKSIIDPIKKTIELQDQVCNKYIRIKKEEEEKIKRELEIKRLYEEKKEKERLDKLIEEEKLKGNKEIVKELKEDKKNIFIPIEIVKEEKLNNAYEKKQTVLEIKDVNKILLYLMKNNYDVTNLIEFKIEKLKQFIKLNNIKSIDGLEIKEENKLVYKK